MNIKKLTVIASGLLLAGCAGVVVAQSITGVAEIVASNCVQKKYITVAQLSTLATDLQAFPKTPLPATDNAVIANLISEAVAHKAADLTAASAVDALNNALSAVQQGSVTALQGVAWANLQDAVVGFQAAVKNAQANPQLAPSAINRPVPLHTAALPWQTVALR